MPAGEHIMRMVHDEHALIEAHVREAADAREKHAERDAAAMAEARAAAEARSAKMAKAAPARRDTRSLAAANQKTVAKPDQVAAVKPADPSTAGPPLTLASATPPAEEPQRGFLTRMADRAGAMGSGAWDAVTSAARWPAQLLPGRVSSDSGTQTARFL